MLKTLFFSNYTLPAPLRQGHPLVQHHLRQPALRHFRQLIFGSSIGMFMLFGGLSLPVLYLLLSLVIFIQLAAGTAERVYRAQEVRTWDLIRLTPYSRREVLLSTWAAGIWQLNRTWTIPLYWVLHAFVILGVIVFGLWVGEIPVQQATGVVLGGTLLIAFQPFVEMYFSGMVGLLCASLFDDKLISLAAAGLIVLGYWALWIGGVVLLSAIDLAGFGTAQLVSILLLPLLLPCIVGYVAQRVAERRLA
jgi:hypothetical protein